MEYVQPLFCEWFFKIIFASIYSFNQRFQICINNRRFLIRDSILIELKYLSVSIGITTQQRSNLFMRFIVFFVLSQWRLFKQYKLASCFDIIPFNNADNLFTAIYCHLSAFGIVRKMICFALFDLCFQMKAGYIFIILKYNILREIVGLFFSTFF